MGGRRLNSLKDPFPCSVHLWILLPKVSNFIHDLRPSPSLIFCTRLYIVLVHFPHLTPTTYDLMLIVSGVKTAVLRYIEQKHTQKTTSNRWYVQLSLTFSSFLNFTRPLLLWLICLAIKDGVRSRERIRISVAPIIYFAFTLLKTLS